MNDKDIELQKIQILNDWYQGYFNIVGSIIAGGFIALAVLFTTLYYGNPLLLLVVFLILWAGFGYVGKYFLDKSYNGFLTVIDNLHERVSRGETLPPIMELKKLSITQTTNNGIPHTSKTETMTNTDEKPSFHLSHAIELFFASLLGALAAVLFDIVRTAYNSLSVEENILLETVAAAILTGFAFLSISIVYLIERVQWKWRHRKS